MQRALWARGFKVILGRSDAVAAGGGMLVTAPALALPPALAACEEVAFEELGARSTRQPPKEPGAFAALAATGVILGAAYMLWLYRRVILGALDKPELKSILDLDRREIAIFVPLVMVVIWMGVYPSSFLDLIHLSAQNLVDNYQAAIKAAAQSHAATATLGGVQ